MAIPCTPHALTLLPEHFFQSLRLVALDPSQEITITAQEEGLQFDSLRQRYYSYLRGMELAAAQQSLQDTDAARQQLVNELARVIPQLKISSDPLRGSITIRNAAAARKPRSPRPTRPLTFKQTTAPSPVVIRATSIEAILQHWCSLPATDLTRGLEQVYELQVTATELQAFYLELRQHSEELVAFYVDGQLTVTTKAQMHARGQGDMIEAFVASMLQPIPEPTPELPVPEPSIEQNPFDLLRAARSD